MGTFASYLVVITKKPLASVVRFKIVLKLSLVIFAELRNVTQRLNK